MSIQASRPRRVINRHWSRGGTGICNFRESDLPLYVKVVQLFGCPDIVIEPEPFPPTGGGRFGSGFSLHDKKRRKHLSVFWAVFNRVKEEVSRE